MMRKLTLGAIALTASTVIGGSASQANLFITGEVWANQSAAAQNATIGAATGLGTATATFTAPDLAFHDTGNPTDTLASFLSSTPGTVCHNVSGLGCSAPLQNSYFLLHGITGPLAGPHSVTHDDGVQLDIGNNGTLEIDSPGPTSTRTDSFTLNTNFNLPFTLSYGECCGVPATLSSTLPEAIVPEPASLALLGSALVGFGVMRRRRKTS